MDIAALPNPYDYRNPVRDASLFAGRDDELAKLRYEFGQAAPDRPSIYIAIHGRRAAGKTSLLNRAEAIAKECRVLPVRVDLVPGDATPVAFFRKLYEELTTALARQGGPDAPPGAVPAVVRRVLAGGTPPDDFPLEFPESLALSARSLGAVSEPALRADLEYFVRTLGRPIALLIDEAQLIAGDENILSILRALGGRVPGYVFVLAGTSDMITRITGVFSPLLRQFREIKVEPFTETADLRACMLLPLWNIGLDVDCFDDFDHAASELTALTGGNPYEIQLYCHEMFARWQRNTARKMALTPEILESIRSRMEDGRDVLDRRLIKLVRRMSPERLEAFNILCSALGHATLDQVWFAYNLLGDPRIDRETLERCRAELLDAGVLREDAEGILDLELETELFDEIYVRLWAHKNLPNRRHLLLMGRFSYRFLLSLRLSRLLHEMSLSPALLLPTCCPVMGAEHLQAALSALECLTGEEDGPFPYAVSYVHDAILHAGMPRALDITEVTCIYGAATAVRWLFAADSADFDICSHPEFTAAAARVSEMGGTLRAERTRLPLRNWSEVVEWLARFPDDMREDFARNHEHVAYHAYEDGDTVATRDHFATALRFAPTFSAANGLAYVSLKLGDARAAVESAERAVTLTQNPAEKALAHYNCALAWLRLGDRRAAEERLLLAAQMIRSSSDPGFTAGYLLLPRDGADVEGADVELVERSEVHLGRAIEQALSLLGRSAEDTGEDVTSRVRRAPRPIVLVVATEWASAHGGLSTLNRDLCRALAAAGAQVYCTVPAASEKEIAAASEAGVTLLRAPEVPGLPALSRLYRRPRLPDGVTPDLIIGHGRITGPAAECLQSDFYPNAMRFHFVHMAPDEIEWHKPGQGVDAGTRAEERTELEPRLGAPADRLVAVGPRLHNRFRTELSGTGAPPPLRLDPGFDMVDTSPRTPPQGHPAKILFIGRIEDAALKGVDLAARACGLVCRRRERHKLPPIELVVRGAPAGTADEQRERIREWAANPKLGVVVRPYSADEERLDADLERASLVIMPSRSEGFGLVAAEAIATGVPTLVSENSGLAELLQEVLDNESAARMIVPMSGVDDEDAESWAWAIETVMYDVPAAFARAEQVRATLSEKVTWADAAATLLNEVAGARASRRGRA